ncbi:MAG: SsrA-binding protein, partial [Candidatus Saccharimonadales bacterium]
MRSQGIKIVSNNKRALFDYEILERFEAGLVLTGTEIKSVRDNRVNLQRSYVQAHDGELW